MRTDTLSYKYYYEADKKQLFRTLLNEQLKYFKRADPTISQLTSGTKIKTQLQTKINKLQTENYMQVKQIIPNELFQLETQQQDGVILQTFKFAENRRHRKYLIYSEQNTFNKSRSQMNFMFIGGLYKLIYNHGIKKRMQYLDQLAHQSA